MLGLAKRADLCSWDTYHKAYNVPKMGSNKFCAAIEVLAYLLKQDFKSDPGSLPSDIKEKNAPRQSMERNIKLIP